MALFYMSPNHNTRQLDSHVYFCNPLQWTVLVQVPEGNLASHRYAAGKRSVSMTCSSLRVHQNSCGHFLKVGCNLGSEDLPMNLLLH